MRAKGHRERSVTMSDPLEETISLSDMTEITETEDPRATQHGSTLGTDPSGQANQLEGGKSEPGDTEVRKKTTTLQEKLDAIWTSETPGTGGAFDLGRYRRHHPAATHPRRRFRAPQSKTGCAEVRMTRMEEQDKHSTRRSHSTASTLGSLTAACRWELRQGGHLCPCRMVRTA